MFVGINMYWARIKLSLAPSARKAEKTNLQRKGKESLFYVGSSKYVIGIINLRQTVRSLPSFSSPVLCFV